MNMKSYRFFKSLPAIILFVFLVNTVCAQEYKTLVADDFKGIPPAGNPYLAYTYAAVTYRIKVLQMGNKPDLEISVTTTFLPEQSWINKEKIKNPEMLQEALKHEQGHYYIAVLLEQEAKKKLLGSSYTSNYKNEIATQFKKLLTKYEKMEIEYDLQTDHMRNRNEQKKWDEFFKEKIVN
jgi:hypothetical protein